MSLYLCPTLLIHLKPNMFEHTHSVAAEVFLCVCFGSYQFTAFHTCNCNSVIMQVCEIMFVTCGVLVFGLEQRRTQENKLNCTPQEYISTITCYQLDPSVSPRISWSFVVRKPTRNKGLNNGCGSRKDTQRTLLLKRKIETQKQWFVVGVFLF